MVHVIALYDMKLPCAHNLKNHNTSVHEGKRSLNVTILLEKVTKNYHNVNWKHIMQENMRERIYSFAPHVVRVSNE